MGQTAACRRRVGMLVTLGAIAALCLPTAALGQTAPFDSGGFTSANVRWVTTVPIYGTGTWMPGAGMGWTDSGSGRVANGHLFVWAEGVSVYDISDPLAPRLVSYIQRPPPPWANQPVLSAWAGIGRFDTNGEILVMPGWDRDDPGDPPTHGPPPRVLRYFSLYVYDVRDPANPKEIGKLSKLPYPNATNRSVGGPFCILDCTWVYDRWGTVVDLRDPSRPRLLRKRWTRGLDFNNSRSRIPGATEMNEIAPGKLLIGSHPMYLLDVRDPRHPEVLVQSDGSPYSRGDVAWPDFPHGDVVVSTNIGEGGSPRCDMDDDARESSAQSVFATWDASGWDKTGFIPRDDSYRLRNGNYADGDPAYSGWEGSGGYGYDNGCNFGRFDVRPARGTIELAVGAHGHGVKLFQVAPNGRIELADWFLGHGANVVQAFWANDEVVYAIDANRGIDVLQVDR